MGAIWETIQTLITHIPGFFFIILIFCILIVIFIGTFGARGVDVERQADFIAAQIQEDIKNIEDSVQVPVLIELKKGPKKLLVEVGLFSKVQKSYVESARGKPAVCVTDLATEEKSCVELKLKRCSVYDKGPCVGSKIIKKTLGVEDILTIYSSEKGAIEIV